MPTYSLSTTIPAPSTDRYFGLGAAAGEKGNAVALIASVLASDATPAFNFYEDTGSGWEATQRILADSDIYTNVSLLDEDLGIARSVRMIGERGKDKSS